MKQLYLNMLGVSYLAMTLLAPEVGASGTLGSNGLTEAERVDRDNKTAAAEAERAAIQTGDGSLQPKNIETHDGSGRLITQEEKLDEAEMMARQREVAESTGLDGATRLLFEPEADYEGPTYRHKNISRFEMGNNAKFKFKDFEFTPKSASDNEEFLREVKNLEPMDRNAMVEVNKVALAASERRLSDPNRQTAEERREAFVRGAATADSILTAKDREAIAAANTANLTAGAGGLRIPPAGGPKPFSPLNR